MTPYMFEKYEDYGIEYRIKVNLENALDKKDLLELAKSMIQE